MPRICMPTYDYFCEKCGHQFELFQSMLAKPLQICPKDRCARQRWGRGKVRKMIGSGAGIIFKGSGFYITDYRSENYKQAAKKETAPGSGDGKPAKANAGPDAKPAAAPTTESKPTKPPKGKD